MQAPPRFAPAPKPAGLWRRTPPAIFPPILGLFGLGLAWRKAADVFPVPAAVGELMLGAVTLVFLFALVAWLSKPLRRPGVVLEELRALPGRAGVAAMSLSMMLMAAALVPYAPQVALAAVVSATALHLVQAVLVLLTFWRGPADTRVVTPVWHLIFAAFIVGCSAWVPLGHVAVAQTLFAMMLPVACGILGASLWQFVQRVPPVPLRPLLAIHVAPISLLSMTASQLGHTTLALGFALAALTLAVVVAGAARWLTAAGFSPLWGAFTFPAAALCNALMLVAPRSPLLEAAAGITLVGATLIILPIAGRIGRDWASGRLAGQTNAATA